MATSDTSPTLHVHPDRASAPRAGTREVARHLYDAIKDLPLTSPHSHVPAQWLTDNEAFPDPANILLRPDHYVLRLLTEDEAHATALDLVTTIPKKVFKL